MATRLCQFLLFIFFLTQSAHLAGQCNEHSVEFDGVNDYVESQLNNSSCNSFTMMFWVKFPITVNTPLTSSKWLAAYAALSPSYSGFTDGVLAGIGFGYNTGPGEQNYHGYTWPWAFTPVHSTVTTYTGGVWYHFAYTRNASGIQKLYVNGILNSSNSYTTPTLTTNQTKLNIGGHGSFSNGVGRWFTKCKIDELVLYNRELSVTEIITKRYQVLNTSNEVNLIGYFRFEEGTGTQTADLGPTNATGMLKSGAHFTTDTPFNNPANPTSASITLNSNPIKCQGDSVLLTANTGLAYLWSTGAISRSIYAKVTGNYTVTVSDMNGCSIDTESVYVTFIQPVATLSHTSADTVLCKGEFDTLTASAALSYLWSNGLTTNSITTSQAGIYQVTVTDQNGCTAKSNILSLTIDNLTASITLNGDSVICPKDSIVLTSSSTGNYQWSDGSTQQSITVFQSGIFTLTVTDNQGCKATSAPVSIFLDTNSIKLVPLDDLEFCYGDSVTITTDKAVQQLTWNTGFVSPQNTYSETGKAYAYFISENNCKVYSDTLEITKHDLPSASFLHNTNSVCKNNTIYFVNTGDSMIGYNYLWNFGDSSTSNNFSPSHNYLTSGTYAVKLKVISNYGCQDSAQELINVGQPIYPVANFSITDSVISIFSTPLTFTNQSQNFNSSYWSFGDNQYSNESNPSHQYTKEGAYIISLTVTSASGCDSTIHKKIIVLPFFIPNSFTPNNDGTNDIFPGALADLAISRFYFEIWNRWGERVFKSNSISRQFVGMSENGQIVPEGTYIYTLKLTGLLGFEYEMTGFVNLIR